MEPKHEQTKDARRSYPIAHCPNCRRAILYSDDPRDKRDVTVRVAEEDHHGKTVLCAKCKKMLILDEKPKVAKGFVAIPIVRQGAL